MIEWNKQFIPSMINKHCQPVSNKAEEFVIIAHFFPRLQGYPNKMRIIKKIIEKNRILCIQILLIICGSINIAESQNEDFWLKK